MLNLKAASDRDDGPDLTPLIDVVFILHIFFLRAASFAVREKGLGVEAARPGDVAEAEAADRKREAFLRYLDDIDEAVHARRLDAGDTGLIGVAAYAFIVRPDGTFTEPELRLSSGSPRLDEAARRAVLAASGKVKRPALFGSGPIPVMLHVKYQYGLR